MSGKSTLDSSAKGGRKVAPSAEALFYPPEEIASLVRSLDRRQDNRLFSKDVLLTYPQLAAAYTKVCPRRCDLATAAQSALEGKYSTQADLALLKDDIQLMVNNCVRFNGANHPLAAVAEDFERFAMEKIRAFVESKSGGRRPSSLRIQPRLREDPSPAPVSTRRGSGGSSGGGAEEEGIFTPKDVAQLVASLIRREDAGAFVVDVAEAYPELRDAYEAACPQRTNLRLMKTRAQQGVYTTAPPDPVGRSAAECLPLLRDDIELMVGNCIRFNAQVEAWVALARRFQAFAHRRVDDFVLARLPHLRGALTGADAFTAAATGGGVGAGAAASEESGTVASSAMDTGLPMGECPTPETKRARTERGASVKAQERGVERSLAVGVLSVASATTARAAAGVQVRVVADVAPTIRPMPVQPELSIPLPLRRRLVADHLARQRTPLRMVGASLPLSELVPPPPPPPLDGFTSAEGGHTVMAVEDAERGVLSDGETTSHAAGAGVLLTPEQTDGIAGESETSPLVTVPASMSAAEVLRAFRSSVSAFFHRQRTRVDFGNAFGFTMHEEQCYLRVIDTIAAEFEPLLPRALLYEEEAAELLHHVGAAAVRQGDASTGGVTGGPPDGAPVGFWAARVHYCYLVRFLVQFPQVASLCVCNAERESVPRRTVGRPPAAGPESSRQESLRISKDALTAIQYVRKVVQEFLVFVADYEETALRAAKAQVAA